MSPLPEHVPHPGQLFRHVDGAFYMFLCCARHTDDTEPLFIYEHVWPFVHDAPWARPAREWASRFTPVSTTEFEQACARGREIAQQEVSQAKAARRAKEAAAAAASLNASA